MSFQDPDDREAWAKAQMDHVQQEAEKTRDRLAQAREEAKKKDWVLKCHSECRPGLSGLKEKSKRHGNQSGDAWYIWELSYEKRGDGLSPGTIGWVFAANPEHAMAAVREAAEHDNIARPYTIVIKREWVVEDVARVATTEVKPT